MSATRAGGRRRPTMRDVATKAGVSVQTVSNFVNRRFNLMTGETRSQIDRAMRELAYHPNVAARSLRSSRTATLGFLVLDESARFLADPMTDLVIAGIGHVARENGYGLLIQAARPDAPEPALMQPLLENRVDGAFLFLSGEREVRQWYVRRMLELGFEFVVFEDCSPLDAPSVTAANRDGARRLAEYLLGRGHRRLAFLAARMPWPMIEQRHAGYLDALAGAGIERDPDLEVFDGLWDPASGARSTARLLELPQPPTAIVSGNDLLAIGAIRAAREQGLSVPDDLAVTGFDDFEFAEYLDPPLTTVRIPGYEMGRTAAELLIGRLEGKTSQDGRVELPVELCLRASA